MPKRPSVRVAEARRDRLMAAQAEVVAEKLAALVGTEDEVLLETPPARRGAPWTGRTGRQAPDDIDGVTYVRGVPAGAKPGDFLRVRIVGRADYDLVAEA